MRVVVIVVPVRQRQKNNATSSGSQTSIATNQGGDSQAGFTACGPVDPRGRGHLDQNALMTGTAPVHHMLGRHESAQGFRDATDPVKKPST